jgi:hypothetical protein
MEHLTLADIVLGLVLTIGGAWLSCAVLFKAADYLESRKARSAVRRRVPAGYEVRFGSTQDAKS